MQTVKNVVTGPPSEQETSFMNQPNTLQYDSPEEDPKFKIVSPWGSIEDVTNRDLFENDPALPKNRIDPTRQGLPPPVEDHFSQVLDRSRNVDPAVFSVSEPEEEIDTSETESYRPPPQRERQKKKGKYSLLTRRGPKESGRKRVRFGATKYPVKILVSLRW